MKTKTIVLFTLVYFLSIAIFSQDVSKSNAFSVAKNFIDYQGKNNRIATIKVLSEESKDLAWIANLIPPGFILIPTSKNIRPVVAYSFESSWNDQNNQGLIFTTILKADLKNRYNYPENNPGKVIAINNEWDDLLNGMKEKSRLEYWPPEGTTPTGGWLFTNWSQGSPYNKMCPIDGNTGQRSYTGCPATAMSMILNCLMDVKEIQFNESDDYYHSFGAGNQYWIDDDWYEFGFPSFDSLNVYLDSIAILYAEHKLLDADQVAALNFACGVSLKQVFSSSASGTFGIEQAADAFQRFGFEESRLVYDTDTTLTADLIENIKTGWPAQLGLVDPPPVSVGHNVVVDGYNSDDYFHFNFGWGGSSNGWYTMPPTSIPYNLTVIEGIVLDIKGNNTYVGISDYKPSANQQIKISWMSPEGIIKITSLTNSDNQSKYYIINANGIIIETGNILIENNKAYMMKPRLKYNGLFVFMIVDEKNIRQTIKFIN